MKEVPQTLFPVESAPRLDQCGLCIHGGRERESFRQEEHWSLHYYHYSGELMFRGGRYAFSPGWASLLPPGETVTWKFPRHAPHFYAHFRVAAGKAGTGVEVPVVRSMIPGEERFGADMEELPVFFAMRGSRARVRLWDLLHRYVSLLPRDDQAGNFHPAVQISLSLIRNAGSKPLTVAELARETGYSRNSITRLFQNAFGCGPKRFLLEKQLERACDLLSKSSLPVKSVAFECGFPDLHHFNKLIRQHTGHSPTSYRSDSRND